MKAVYASSNADLQKIKDLGFDTIIGNFKKEELDKMQELGLSCIFSGNFIDHCVIIGYYLYDEPDLANISIEEQEKKIFEYRSKTDKKLVVCIMEEMERKCSLNYDLYLFDIYYMSNISKFKNYLNIAISSHIIRLLYKNKKIVPILGLFDDMTIFKYSDEIYKFDKKFRSYFRDSSDLAVYVWKGSGINPDTNTGYNGIVNREIYQQWATKFNASSDECWWITSKFLFTISWLFLKINPLLGKFKIKI